MRAAVAHAMVVLAVVVLLRPPVSPLLLMPGTALPADAWPAIGLAGLRTVAAPTGTAITSIGIPQFHSP
jgi:hypothetical protein